MNFDVVTYSAVRKLNAATSVGSGSAPIGSLLLVPDMFESDEYVDTGFDIDSTLYPDLAKFFPKRFTDELLTGPAAAGSQVVYDPSSVAINTASKVSMAKMTDGFVSGNSGFILDSVSATGENQGAFLSYHHILVGTDGERLLAYDNFTSQYVVFDRYDLSTATTVSSYTGTPVQSVWDFKEGLHTFMTSDGVYIGNSLTTMVKDAHFDTLPSVKHLEVTADLTIIADHGTTVSIKKLGGNWVVYDLENTLIAASYSTSVVTSYGITGYVDGKFVKFIGAGSNATAVQAVVLLHADGTVSVGPQANIAAIQDWYSSCGTFKLSNNDWGVLNGFTGVGSRLSANPDTLVITAYTYTLVNFALKVKGSDFLCFTFMQNSRQASLSTFLPLSTPHLYDVVTAVAPNSASLLLPNRFTSGDLQFVQLHGNLSSGARYLVSDDNWVTTRHIVSPVPSDGARASENYAVVSNGKVYIMRARLFPTTVTASTSSWVGTISLHEYSFSGAVRTIVEPTNINMGTTNYVIGSGGSVPQVQSYCSMTGDDSGVYAHVGSNFFYSVDGFATTKPIAPPNIKWWSNSSPFPAYATTSNGITLVSHSRDTDQNSYSTTSFNTASIIKRVNLKSGTTILCDNSYFIKSTNGGASWTSMPSPSGVSGSRSLYSPDGKVVVVTGQPQTGKLVISYMADEDSTWSTAVTHDKTLFNFVGSVHNGNIVFTTSGYTGMVPLNQFPVSYIGGSMARVPEVVSDIANTKWVVKAK